MRAILLLLATAAASANHIIHPCFDASCAHWNDTKGERIESHSAGMLQSPTDKRWYWYGESKKTADLSDHGVNCYSAPDIAGPWTNEGSVLGQSQVKIPGKTGPFVIERPKVIYNAATKNFVMWFHLDDNGYKVRERPRVMCCSGGSCGLTINGITRGGSSKGWCGVLWLVSPLTHTSVHPPLLPVVLSPLPPLQFRHAGVAVSSSPSGPFTFTHALQPDGIPSLDMSLFLDPVDGTAYFIRSCDNKYDLPPACRLYMKYVYRL